MLRVSFGLAMGVAILGAFLMAFTLSYKHFLSGAKAVAMGFVAVYAGAALKFQAKGKALQAYAGEFTDTSGKYDTHYRFHRRTATRRRSPTPNLASSQSRHPQRP